MSELDPLEIACTPTINVDVGGVTVWRVTNSTSSIRWSSPGSRDVIQLDGQGDGVTCQITGLKGGETTITAQEMSGQGRERTLPISVGLMFVYGPDGNLYAAPTASFSLVENTQARVLNIPTLAEMAEKEAYYVPPSGSGVEGIINVTCYVINLGYIRSNPDDLWTPSSSAQGGKKKSGQ
ncbi:hypothetical protein POL68_39155 [Stigmatella sp. ncwal1]|uniref:BIG2 domain-containing protein n=1 Tax=Stigmatella ashevillensis TaxID=2995309 RepID=A0ABT5DLJ2_9BACT|nr:hypothetical protein [Stigmatella ashevillena]MDC0714532.1 hypothetical protein [Stigmatella ashevillena]